MSIECHNTRCPAHDKEEPFCDEPECLFARIKRDFKVENVYIWDYLTYSYPACSKLSQKELIADFDEFLEK